MLKHFEIIFEVLQLYCNVVVHNQAGTTRDDSTDRKQIFHRTKKLHTSPTKQADVDCCCRGCSDPSPNTNVQMNRPTDWHRQTDGHKIEKKI